MKIGIYSEFQEGNTLGGREYIAGVLCEALSPKNDVTLVHHEPKLTAEAFADHFALPRDSIQLRYLPEQPTPSAKNPWRRHQEERAWHAELSVPYELFIYIAHYLPPFCRARVGVLYVLFPFYDPRRLFDFDSPRAPRVGGGLWRKARRAFHTWEWRSRLRSYKVAAAISGFSAHWTRELWHVDSAVVFPPADGPEPAAEKRLSIVSVGRFSVTGVLKRQDVMMQAFGRVVQMPGAANWSYTTAGAAGEAPAEQAFTGRVRELAEGLNAHVHLNVRREQLRDIVGSASIFWHAAGYGQEDEPGLAEHFGIATAEAMMAGCVPVVIRKGAQPEIVEHGISGFLWENEEELVAYTHQLMNSPELLQRMSRAARERALRLFSRERFVENFANLLRPHVPNLQM